MDHEIASDLNKKIWTLIQKGRSVAEIIKKKAVKRCVSVFLNFPRRHQKNAIFLWHLQKSTSRSCPLFVPVYFTEKGQFLGVDHQLKIYPQKMSESEWISFEIVINVASRKRFE